VSVIGLVIEVATIDGRHRRSILLRLFGIQIILRLGVDPVRLPPGTMKRTVTVDRISPGSEKTRWEEMREIAWNGLTDHFDQCEEIARTLNQHDITEHAAIGVMLLLIHELEGAVLTDVLPIGSGGDYLVNLSDRPEPVQVEVSGIREGSASQAATRLEEKRSQIRGAGFVSVTTFLHSEDGSAHSYLHFVVPGVKAEKPGSIGRKRERGKPS
jgi:hypothetical protein